MEFFVSVFFIAVSLALDAFSVALAAGSCCGKVSGRNMAKMSFFFGFFQFIMPVIGWCVGVGIARFISQYDHWIILAVLTFVGGKMIYESVKSKNEDVCETKFSKEIFHTGKLALFALLTSIDALTVGFTFSIIKYPVFLSSVIIGIVTAAITLVGILIGKSVSRFLGQKAEIFGGIVLIGLGIKYFLELL